MKAEINNLIALCHIIDEFKEFEKRLLPIMSINHYGVFAYQLEEVSKGKIQFGAQKLKKFYNENKSVVDTINKYSNITKFILSCYLSNRTLFLDMQNFYKYIYDHKDEKEKILAVLEKLKELGFNEVELFENADFTKNTYYAHPSFGFNYQFDYVANPQNISNNQCSIFYKTTDSNYLIKLRVDNGNIHADKLFLNSLVFDSKSLPKSLSREDTFDCILNSNKKQKEQSDDLTTCASDLKEKLKSAIETINELDVVKDKDKLIEITANIRDNVEKLKALCEGKDNSLVEEPSSSPATLGKGTKVIVRKKNR